MDKVLISAMVNLVMILPVNRYFSRFGNIFVDIVVIANSGLSCFIIDNEA